MLYNVEKKKIRESVDCVLCDKFNRTTKTCEGFGKVCFEYDEKTKTIVDPITKLPISISK